MNIPQAKKPRLADADAPAAHRAAPTEEPLGQLQATARAIEGALFTNAADRRAVQRLLFKLEWTMHVAIEEVLARRSGSAALTVDAPSRSSHGASARPTDGVELLAAQEHVPVLVPADRGQLKP